MGQRSSRDTRYGYHYGWCRRQRRDDWDPDWGFARPCKRAPAAAKEAEKGWGCFSCGFEWEARNTHNTSPCSIDFWLFYVWIREVSSIRICTTRNEGRSWALACASRAAVEQSCLLDRENIWGKKTDPGGSGQELHWWGVGPVDHYFQRIYR